jgi:hypothetical protein
MRTDVDLKALIARVERLEKVVFADSPDKFKATKVAAEGPSKIDFSIPIRAFIKKYCVRMNGSKKFTLVVAYLAKGDEAKGIPLSEIEAQWNRMTSEALLGMKFNRLYSAQARENDWVNSGKGGIYNLRPAWRSIFD